ncbi:MAG: pyridoxamine 5'-phosphate oxidase family protein [Mongoliitalea sp.]
MLIKPGSTLDVVFQDAQQEVRRGVVDKKHPFRFITLATVQDSIPEARYVVLRKVDEQFNFYAYTDVRTRKVQAMQSNPMVSILLYHPQKRVQVRIQAAATIHHKDSIASDHWTRVQGEAQKAYNSILAPGEAIQTPEQAYFWEEELSNSENFAVILLKPFKLEVLQLNGLEHLRAEFDFTPEGWQGKWLVP